MALQKWTHSQRKILFKHPRLTLLEDIVNLPDGTIMPYLRAAPSTKDSVAVIAINEKGEILVQKEYSYPPNEIMWQLPGGGSENNESVVDTARRELREESGYIAKDAKVIGHFFTANRLSDQKQYVVLCTGLSKEKVKPDQGEFIENYWLRKEDIAHKVARGEITNINFLACLQLFEHMT